MISVSNSNRLSLFRTIQSLKFWSKWNPADLETSHHSKVWTTIWQTKTYRQIRTRQHLRSSIDWTLFDQPNNKPRWRRTTALTTLTSIICTKSSRRVWANTNYQSQVSPTSSSQPTTKCWWRVEWCRRQRRGEKVSKYSNSRKSVLPISKRATTNPMLRILQRSHSSESNKSIWFKLPLMKKFTQRR